MAHMALIIVYRLRISYYTTFGKVSTFESSATFQCHINSEDVKKYLGGHPQSE